MPDENVRTTAVPGPPTTTTVDDPMCTCCTPQQPLEPMEPGKNEYRCPVTGLKYTFDPAEGVVQPVQAATRSSRTETTSREGGFYPEAPSREEVRRVDPSDPFA